MQKQITSIRLTNQAQPILEIKNKAASARISLFGGQLLSFIPRHDGRERLWLSSKAIWDGSKPIRGGVPICWPWFGDHPDKQYSAHGYVRCRIWQLLESSESEHSTNLILAPLDSQGAGVDGQASLLLNITIGIELSIKLITSNIGDHAFSYTCALHSYFKVQNIHNVNLTGLKGEYADKPSGFKRFLTPHPYRFTEETDRIHLNAANKVCIVEETLETEVYSDGHDSIVVWNPWQENSTQLADMENEDYKHMLCVETAVTKGITLEPGASHVLEQKII